MQGKLVNFKTSSQCRKVLDYLKTGASLTCLEAIQLGLTHNLRSRISNLKDAGNIIHSEKVKVNGTYIAKYTLSVEKLND